MKKLFNKIKNENKKIKEIIKIINEKHNYTWEKEGKEVKIIFA